VGEFIEAYGGKFLEGFLGTVTLSLVAGLLATFFGLVLASMRVSPIPVLRAAATAYINVVRNTPLTLVFLAVSVGFPVLDIQFTLLEPLGYNTFFVFAVVALASYTSCFVAEAVRSGINAVPPGQAEAARAVGMTFPQTLGTIVLPQAVRTALPPLASVYIAMVKNSAIAEFFAVAEATKVFDDLARDDPSLIWIGFAAIAAGYMILTLGLSGVFHLLERRMAVAR
jgi:glutamate transport system permease protein